MNLSILSLKYTLFSFVLILFVLLGGTLPVAAASVNTEVRHVVPGFQVLASDDQETVIAFTLPEYTLRTVAHQAGACQQLEIEGYAQSGENGAPQLPIAGTLLGVPPQAALSVEVISNRVENLPGSFVACPAAQAVAEEGEDGMIRYVEKEAQPDPALFSQATPYPAEIVTVEDLGFMRSQRMARLQVSPLQINPSAATAVIYSYLEIRLRHAGSPQLRAASAEAEPALFEQSLQGALLNYTNAQKWRSQESVQAAFNPGWTPPNPGYRIAVKRDGFYAVTYEELKAGGVPVDTLVPANLRLFHNGQEVAIRVVNTSGSDDSNGRFDPGDRLLFYGEAVNDKYTDTNIYWLTFGNTPGLRMTRVNAAPTNAATVQSAYTETVHLEQNSNYVSAAPNVTGYEHWFGPQIRVLGLNNSNNRSFNINLSEIATSALTATLEIGLVSVTTGRHQLNLYFNEQKVYTGAWLGKHYQNFVAPVDARLLQNGDNAVTIELNNGSTGQTFDIIYVDWIKLHYQRNFTAQDNQIRFRNPVAKLQRYTVSGFNSQAVEAYDITDPHQPVRLMAPVDNGQIDFQGSGAHYYVSVTANYLSPHSITVADTMNLTLSTLGADYIIITHADFLDAIQPLAQYRAQQGKRVVTVNVQHIYDTFNHGRVSAEAIRDFLSYAYHNWEGSAPFYVLLVGDGTYDPKGYLTKSSPTFIPPYLEMVDPVMGETAADNRYVTVFGPDILPDMNLGRFPAQTSADVTAMVEKTIAYERADISSGWNRNVLFVTDNLEGGGGAFHSFSESVAEGTFESRQGEVPFLPSGYNKIKLYLDENCTAESCRTQLLEQLNQGALLVSYVGHGTKQYWAEEQLLSLSSISAMNTGGRLPIMLPMTCLEGYYHEAEAGFESFGESVVRAPGGGAVASWSPTGLGLVTGHDYLEKGFFIALFYNDIKAVGVITTIGKLYLKQNAPPHKYDDLLDTFVLLGDPALQVRVLNSPSSGTRFQVYLPALAK